MDDLNQLAHSLNIQARKIIESSDFSCYLSNFGELVVVGSVSYGLMTWREIDLDVVIDERPSDESFWEVVRHFFDLEAVRSVTISDNRQGREENRPISMYIGLKYSDQDGETWKVDIRMLGKDDVSSDKTVELIAKEMRQEHRQAILAIKTQVHSHPQYHREFSSFDIYQAVIRHRVKTLAQFRAYLENRGIYI